MRFVGEYSGNCLSEIVTELLFIRFVRYLYKAVYRFFIKCIYISCAVVARIVARRFYIRVPYGAFCSFAVAQYFMAFKTAVFVKLDIKLCDKLCVRAAARCNVLFVEVELCKLFLFCVRVDGEQQIAYAVLLVFCNKPAGKA